MPTRAAKLTWISPIRSPPSTTSPSTISPSTTSPQALLAFLTCVGTPHVVHDVRYYDRRVASVSCAHSEQKPSILLVELEAKCTTADQMGETGEHAELVV